MNEDDRAEIRAVAQHTFSLFDDKVDESVGGILMFLMSTRGIGESLQY